MMDEVSSSLTLEEAIKHCEEVAEENEKTCEAKPNVFLERYRKCASEHRQLAEWLRELKAYREELPKEIKNAKVRQADVLEANVKNENYNSYLAEYIKGYLCGLSYTEGIIAKIIEEVKADDKGKSISDGIENS